MDAEKISYNQSFSTGKPRISDDDIPFFQCPNCQKIVMGLSCRSSTAYSDIGHNPSLTLPYMEWEHDSTCCGDKFHPVQLVNAKDHDSAVSLEYQIRGGLGTNLITLAWSSRDARHVLEWLVLKTFTGMQLKYPAPNKPASLSFALSDEDSYAYCGEDPCKECRFLCKSGMVFYAYFTSLGLVRFPIHTTHIQ